MASKNRNSAIALIISLIIFGTTLVAISSSSQLNIGKNTETVVIQTVQKSTISINFASINETDNLKVTNSYGKISPASLKTDPISLNSQNFTTFSQLNMSGFFFPPINSLGQSLIDGSDPNSNFQTSTITGAILLDASKFVTYTYGGSPVQQPDSAQFIFSYPDCCNSQGQITGSDALAWNSYAIQKIDFDAAFVAPKISALGFDEMVIFAASNTTTYKGTEFGIRMDLKDGFVYGYLQEPNGNYGCVCFNMQELIFNDGIMHHYTLIMSGTAVSFCIDGIEYGNLIFPSNTNYSNLGFSICAVVHRFTDGWDSSGDNMIAGNFFLNQQQ
jgi:hypothetical protein